MNLLAQVFVQRGGINAGWSFGEIVIAIIIIAAVLGILYAVLQYFGVPIPPIVMKILCIVLIAALAIIAVRFLLSL
jgi:hypothetical protein